MKSIRPLFKFLVIPAILAVIAIGFHTLRKDTSDFDGRMLATVEKRDFQVTVQTVGVLHAEKSHMISSEIGGSEGKIIYLIGDGEHVEEGEVLVRLDPAPFQDEIVQQKAEVDSYTAATDAAGQLLEWEKNEVNQQITTARYNLKVSKLELERLVKGEGPLQLTQLKDEMEKARLDMSKYQAYVTDLEALQEKGFDNPAELSQAKEQLQVFREKYEAAKGRYVNYEKYVLPSMIESANAKVQNSELSLRQTEQSSVHKIAKAQASLQQIEAKLRATQSALKQAQTKLENAVIEAPFPGLVIHYETFRNGQMRKPREGDSVIMGQPILYLPDISELQVKGMVREIDLHKIGIGQEAAISVEAYPDTDFRGNLSFIGALASRPDNRQGGEKYFQVTLTLNTRDDRLRPGMTAKVVIFSADLKNVLSVPIQAVFFEGGTAYCYRVSGGRANRTGVQIGKQNEHFAEVLEGLRSGDVVSLVRPEN